MWKVWDNNLWWTQKTEKAQAVILNWLVTGLTKELLVITVPANIIIITYLIYCYWASAQSLHIQTLLMYFPLFSCPCFSTSASNESVTGALHLTQVGTKFTNVTYTSVESKCCLHSLQLMISLKDKGTSTGIIIKKYIQVDSRSRIIAAYLSMQ